VALRLVAAVIGIDMDAYSGNRGDVAPVRQACDQAKLSGWLLRRMTDT